MSSNSNQSNNEGLGEAQKQVDEITGIMKDNVLQVLERGGKLNELGERAESLKEGAKQFERKTTEVKEKYSWENKKMKIIIGVIISVIILVIVLIILSEVLDW